MPKLNTTIDNLELKTNRVTGSIPSASWTDAQYPSAKTLYSTYESLSKNYTSVASRCTSLEATRTNLLNLTHPVGSVMITSSNTSPASNVGGTWSLIDKGFKSYHDDGADFFTPVTNVLEEGTWVTRADHTIRIRIAIIINTTATDEENMTLGTLNYSSIGITRIPSNLVGSVTYSDGANCGFSWSLNETTGVIKLTDIFDASQLPSGNSFNIDMTLPVYYGAMADNVCDKFYWKRTA